MSDFEVMPPGTAERLAELEKWRSLASGLHSQFDWQGCTCTFSSEDCCAFARYEAFALKDAALPQQTRKAA